MFKKWFGLTLALCALTLLAGCGGQQAASKAAVTGLSGASVSELLENAANADQPVPAAPVESQPPEPAAEMENFSHDGIDVDLTRMSGTMVYGQVSGMMYLPDDYVGKTIRMRGQSASYYYDETDTTYYSVIIADATACCAQGIEYVLADGGAYPADETGVTVTGVFELYDELGITYCRLADATVSA